MPYESHHVHVGAVKVEILNLKQEVSKVLAARQRRQRDRAQLRLVHAHGEDAGGGQAQIGSK